MGCLSCPSLAAEQSGPKQKNATLIEDGVASACSSGSVVQRMHPQLLLRTAAAQGKQDTAKATPWSKQNKKRVSGKGGKRPARGDCEAGLLACVINAD